MNNSCMALVTGSGRGIGRAIVLSLAKNGWDVVVNYRNDAKSAFQTGEMAKAEGVDALCIQADISFADDRTRLVHDTLEKFNRIDLLVNNAGMAPRQRKDILKVSEESFNEVMDANLKGPLFLSQTVANVMIDQIHQQILPAGRIINISSMSAYTASIDRSEYCISKAGMAMMTALFAARLAEYGIGVFEIRPGIIETDMTHVAKEKYDRLILEENLTPIKRWGSPHDVAKVVLAIIQGLLDFSTGQVINVDGGFHIRRL
jgi:3-oxoacyl-[acyl-carrier protein] reductase